MDSRAAALLTLTPVLMLLVAPHREADEGMWTFDNPPTEQLRERYGFEPDAAWLDHVRQASVRFNSGGSGSFVSADGLVMTNHHVAMGSLSKLSDAENNYAADGFYAATPALELPCPDEELNVLVSIEDVTARVREAAAAAETEAERAEARAAAIAAIEKEETQATGLRCNVVDLYHGGVYSLYRYKAYTDVRLVFAPEAGGAFFGGDFDNFTYPRHCLDVAFFRVYEDDEPAKIEHFFEWSDGGAGDGDLVFVSGNPGSTGRLNTLAQVEYMRDVAYPRALRLIRTLLEGLYAYGEGDEERMRQAKSDIFSLENALKAYTGYLGGLQLERVMDTKRAEEAALRAQAGPANAAWDRITETRATAVRIGTRAYFSRLRGGLAGTARQIRRYAEETAKPDEDREAGFHDSQLESLRFQLLSPAPVYKGLEEVWLRGSLAVALEQLGPDDPFVAAALGGRSPDEVAAEAVAGTRLDDVEVRRALLDGGLPVVDAADDPLMALVGRVEAIVRSLEDTSEEQIDNIEAAASAEIAQARFAAYGLSKAPDATFTLRLSFGAVKGYEEGTTKVPFKTTYAGLLDRSASFDNADPWTLPDSWAEAAEAGALDLATPINFVLTTDIIGGNSGSPVLDRHARVVGLIFDGNIQSLSNRFVYDEEVARAIAVHSDGIREALRSVYGAGPLAAELGSSRPL